MNRFPIQGTGADAPQFAGPRSPQPIPSVWPPQGYPVGGPTCDQDPATIAQVGQIGTGDDLRAGDITPNGETMVWGDDSGQTDMYVMDVSDPADPQVVGTYTHGGNEDQQQLAIHDGVAYAEQDGFDVDDGARDGIVSVDISDPTNPTELDFIDPGQALAGGGPSRPAIDPMRDVLWVCDTALGGILGFDISDPNNLSVLDGTSHGPGFDTHGIAVDGDFAYVVTSADDFHVVNISDPNNLSHEASFSDGTALNGAFDIALDGTKAYVALTSGDGMTVVDISDPSNPTIDGTLTGLGSCTSVQENAGQAYVTTAGSSNLYSIDTSDPSNPTLSDTLNMDSPIFVVTGSRGYKYVGGTTGRMTVTC